MEPLIPLAGDPNRVAVGPARGYSYQALQSLYAWMSLEKNETLILEGAEDYVIHGPEETLAVQVKSRTTKLSLGRREARDAITNFLDLKERNPSAKRILYRYITDAGVGFEQARPFGQEGIRVWTECQRTGEGAAEIRSFFLGSENLEPEIREFLETRTAEEILEELIRPLTWETSSPGPSEIQKKINDLLVELGHEQSLLPTDSKRVLSSLLNTINQKTTKPKEEERQLTWADLRELFERETHLPVPLGVLRRQSKLTDKELIEVRKGRDYTALDFMKKRSREDEGYREIYYHRAEVDDELERLLAERKNVLLLGPPLAGKTRAVFRYVTTRWREAAVALLDSTVLRTKCHEALEELREVGPPEEPCLFILDDIVDFANTDAADLCFLLNEILEISEENQIIATSRSAKLPSVRQALVDLDVEFSLLEILPIPPELRKELEQAKHVARDTLLPASTIGSYFTDSRSQRAFYSNLLESPERPRPKCLQFEILRAARCLDLWRRRNQCARESLADYVDKRLESRHRAEPITDFEWATACGELADNGLATWQKDSLTVETIYLEYLIGRTGRNRDLQSDEELVREALAFYPESGTYARVIGRYPEVDMAFFWSLLDKMRQEAIEIDNWVTSALVSRSRSFSEALNACTGLEARGIQLDQFPYNLLLKRCETADQVQTVLEKMQESEVEPSSHTIGTILRVLANSPERPKVLESVLARGVEPESRAFLVLLDQSLGFHDALENLELFLRMVKSPGKNFLRKFIGSIAKRTTSVDECRQLQKCLQSFGYDLSNYAALRMLQNAEDQDQAERIYKAIRSEGFQVIPSFHTALLKTSPSAEAGLRILEGLRPGEISVNNCNEVLKKALNAKEIASILRFMLDASVAPDTDTLWLLRECLRENKVRTDLTEVLDLVSTLCGDLQPRMSGEQRRDLRGLVHYQLKNLKNGRGTIESLWTTIFYLRALSIEPTTRDQSKQNNTLSLFVSKANNKAKTLARSLKLLEGVSKDPFGSLARELPEKREELLNIELRFLEGIRDRFGATAQGFLQGGYQVVFEQTCGKWREARAILDDLQGRGILDEHLLASVLPNAQNVGKALKAIEASRNHGLELTASGPVSRALVSMATTDWDRQRVEALLTDMPQESRDLSEKSQEH